MADKRSKVRLVGLETLYYGSITAARSFITLASLNQIGNVVPDSAHLSIESPPVTDIMIEEEDTPDLQILGNRKFSFEFATRDMGTMTLMAGLGGSVVNTSGPIWSAPVTSNVITEYGFRATSKSINGKQLQIDIPRASMRVGGDLKFARTDTGTLTFTCDVLVPESTAQIPPIRICQI